MKKIILSVITILIMTFGMITNVNAETCVAQNYTQLNTNVNQTKTINVGTNGQTNNFSSSVNFGNYKYIKGQLWYAITDTSNTIYSNIGITNWNLELTCQRTDTITSGGNTWGYITYQNGSTATISSTLKGVVCDYYSGQMITQNNNATVQTTWKYEPDITGLSLQICTDTFCDLCNVDTNGNFTCPIDSTKTYTKMYWNFVGQKYNGFNIRYGLMSTNLYKCNGDSQEIINNQNQIANQQHNDSQAINNNITNTYNFISSDTIESTTNTDDITSQYDSTSNNNVLNFMLIPINFVNSIINGFGNSCSQVCLGNCSSGGFHDNFNFTFVMPCIDIRAVIGNDIYNTIDSLMCVAMIFAFIRSVVGFAKKALLLEADVSSEVRVF